MIRIDLHSSTGTKLDLDSILEPITCQYSLALGKVGSFAFSIPADLKVAPSVVGGLQAWIYDSNEGLVFKGKIDSTTYQNDSTGRKVLNVSGPSTAVELQERSVGLGLVFEDDDFGDSVDAILDDTDWSAEVLDTAVNVPARRFDGRQKWEALSALADIYQFSIREDNLNSRVDVGAFGVDSGVILTNLRNDIRVLDDLPTQVPLGSMKVLSRSNDIVNRVYPVGQIQGLGGAVLTLSGVSSANPVATRLYFDRLTAPSISPSYDSGWEDTGSAVRRIMDLTPGDLTTSGQDFQVSESTTTNPYDVLRAQWVYGPIGAQTITGNVKAQFLATESAADADARAQMLIKVVSSDGSTSRGTLLGMGTYGNEMSATQQNLTFPTTALSSVTAEDGDYLVVELGVRFGNSTATLKTGQFRIRADGSGDLPEDETTTSDTMNPWIEFSTYIVPQLTADTTYAVQSVTKNGITHYYLEDAASVAAYGLRDRVLNIKDILPLGISIAKLAAASATLYGNAVTYLQRHKDPQVAYEVEPIGLRHYDNGTAYWKVGDKLTVDYLGTVRDIDGVREDLRVKQSLYIISATRTYDSAGASRWQMVVSTVARALADDSTLLAAMLTEIGLAKISPLGMIGFGDGFLQIDESTMQIRSTSATVVTGMVWPGAQFVADHGNVYPRSEVQGYTQNPYALAKMITQSAANQFASVYTFTGIAGNPTVNLSVQTAAGRTASLELESTDGSGGFARLEINGAVAPDIIVQTALVADANDYDVSAASTSSISVSGTAARNITGISATNVLDGSLLIITNTGAFNITLKDESASSSAANRLALTADIVLAPDGGCILQYNATSSRWRCIGKS